MRKFGLIISALALVLGLAQCAKKPNMPIFNGSFKGVNKTITFTANGGNGAKSEIYNNKVLGELSFKWEEGDVIYVYGSENGDFTNGKLCGELALASGQDEVEGTFRGDVVVPEGDNATLRFYYFGSDVTESEGERSVDLSEQNGALNEGGGLKGKIIAMDEINEIGETTEFSGELEVLFAIVQFDLKDFAGDNDVVMSGIKYNKLSVGQNGEIVKTEGPKTTLGKANLGEEEYYVAIITEDVVKLFFDGNGCLGSKTVETGKKPDEFVDGVFYTTSDKKSVKIKGIKDLVPGLYSVSDNHQVWFAKGNLWFGPKDGEAAAFHFEDDQLSGPTTSISSHVSYFFWFTKSYIEKSYASSYSAVGGSSSDDVFFTNNTATTPNSDFVVDGQKGVFRTLSANMSNAEMDYLKGRRMKTDNTTLLYGLGAIADVKGLFLFPDDWTGEKWSGFKYGSNSAYEKNKITDLDFWKALEAAGVVFLKEGGNREGTDIKNRGVGKYHVSSADAKTTSYSFTFSPSLDPKAKIVDKYAREYGRYIRLAADSE
ncbi:MAG: hypothetical protein Q4F69_11140 [Bacteroidia bacterium]|nr:hypothetical protein [Bacteroidia bacterium]